MKSKRLTKKVISDAAEGLALKAYSSESHSYINRMVGDIENRFTSLTKQQLLYWANYYRQYLQMRNW